MSQVGTLERWRGWLGDPQTGGIWDDLVPLLATRQIWKGYVEIVRGNPRIHQPGTFHDRVARLYLVYQATGIRRQSEVDSTVISIARLLDRIAKAPGLVSRSSFLALYGPEDQKVAEGFFYQIAGAGAPHTLRRPPASWGRTRRHRAGATPIGEGVRSFGQLPD